MAKTIEWLSGVCARITTFAVVSVAVLLVCCILISVFFRYVIGNALSWPEELSMFLFVWLVLLAGSLGVRERFHVQLTILTSRLPPKMQKLMAQFFTLVILVFGGVLLYSGHSFLSRTSGNLSATIGYPLEYINLSVVVCGALIILHSLSHLLNPKFERSLHE